MNLSGKLATLLDGARSEAKRAGQATTQLVHLAVAVAKASPDLIGDRLGEDPTHRIREHLEALGPTQGQRRDADELTRLLAQADQAPDSMASIMQGLTPLLDSIRSARPTSRPAPPADAPSGAPQGGQPAPGEPAFMLPSSLEKLVERVAVNAEVVGRDHLVDQIIGYLGRKTPATPCIVGDPGSGRSTVFTALANRLWNDEYTGPLARTQVLRVRADAVVAENRAGSLRRIASAVQDDSILCLDDVGFMAALSGQHADLDALGVIQTLATNSSTRAILSITPSSLSKLEVYGTGLMARLEVLQLQPLQRELLLDIGLRTADVLSQHHGIEIPKTLVELAADQKPGPSGDRAQPALMIEQLDGACVRASVQGKQSADEEDLISAGKPAAAAVIDYDGLVRRLGERVIGQESAIQRIAGRLSLTRRQLDLRPERPDGVFLFVGPSGVGKTELARALSAEVFGAEAALIRIDMSEYADPTAINRLIGPQPGYVGSTEPESWLTTKVIEQPHSVIVLDEVEKAHPLIWNTFLQVFDAGILTDSRGKHADFSSAVIVMTSNIGSGVFAQEASIGFGASASGPDQDLQEERVRAEVKRTMLPELLNRFDDVLVFRPLSHEAVSSIANKELANIVQRLGRAGFELTLAPQVFELIVELGFQPEYGARPLHRALERLILEPLARLPAGHYRGTVRADAIDWELVH